MTTQSPSNYDPEDWGTIPKDDFWSALDLIANFINSLPEMPALEVRSAIYRKCVDPSYQYGQP
jgi:hypothetical protein